MIVDLKPAILSESSSASGPAALIDGYGRRIHHLRLSVISACNLRCIYCKPKADGSGIRRLSDEQRVEFVRYLHERYALTQVRVTGGEPLLYPRLLELIEALRKISPELLLAMTTNAQGLANRAAALRAACLDRLNISIDTLNPHRYRAMTSGELRPVIEGIDAAIAAGFPPPKLNSVVLRGENDDELSTLAAWAFERGCEMRFLEAMPIGPAADVNRRLFVSADEIHARLAEDFELTPIGIEFGATALRFRAKGVCGSGVVGLVAPMTKPFCGGCGRVRLTSDGKLYPCLLDERFADMRSVWVGDVFDAQLADQLIRAIIRDKRAEGPRRQSAAMVSLGG
jgi:cyclic pyranopterin phosphate synthase